MMVGLTVASWAVETVVVKVGLSVAEMAERLAVERVAVKVERKAVMKA